MSATVERALFEDVHDHDGGQVYLSPNEYTMTWREILKGRHIRRAAGICSSGEVGLFSMLPTVREELVLVDHSYRSLAIAMTKYFVMQKYGAEKAHALFTGTDQKSLEKALDEAVKNLPGKVAAIVENLRGDRRYSYNDKWFVNPQSETLRKRRAGISREVQGEWKNLPVSLVKRATTKLDKVVFIHGDLADLVARGPFDLIYLSNALEHTSRTGRGPVATDIEKALKPGGYTLVAHRADAYYAAAGKTPNSWKKVTSTRGKEFGSGGVFSGVHKIGWDHTLFQVPA